MPVTDTAGLAYCRFATLHGDRIAFSAEGNLWEVGLEGGTARRLTSSTAVHTHARYSPDGRWLAFSSADEGPVNAWVMPAEGGPAHRLTFTSTPTQVVGWTPDSSRVVLRVLGLEGVRAWCLATVPVGGGALRLEPFGRADGIAYHADGRRVAVHRHAHDPAWWKRYAGGRAGRLWLGDLETGEFERLPGGPRTDCQPMWIGDALYFLSDQDGMGDLWQVLARELRNWGAAACGRYAALVGVASMAGTLLTGPSIRRLGPRGHTCASTSASVVSSVLLGRATTDAAAYGALVPIALGSGRSHATTARIVNLGTDLGVPQGQLAAERTALNAVIKVIAPTLYAALFAFGAQRGVIALPFYVTASLLAVSVVLASTIQYESSKSTDN